MFKAFRAAVLAAVMAVFVTAAPVSAGEPGSAAWGDSWNFRSGVDRAVDFNTAFGMKQVGAGQMGSGTYLSSSVNIANQNNVTVNAQDSMTTITTGQNLSGGNQQGASSAASQGGNASAGNTQQQH